MAIFGDRSLPHAPSWTSLLGWFPPAVDDERRGARALPPLSIVGRRPADQSKKIPLTTALALGLRFVTLIVTLPETFQERYSPFWNELSVSVLEHLARRVVDDLDLLAAVLVVEIDGIERDLVRLAVGEVEVEAHRGGGVPGRGDPAGVGGVLQGVGGRGGLGPDVGRRAGEAEGGVGGELGIGGGGVGGDVVAVGAVGAAPATRRSSCPCPGRWPSVGRRPRRRSR